jgi:hypothetical protein
VETVIHDDDARASGHAGAVDAIPRNDGRRGARKQERLVADLPRAIARRVHHQRAGKRAAIAAA